jgi:hypothetical protein
MAGENRKVAAESTAHAQGLTDNLTRQGFTVESQTAAAWVLRKSRRRGDHVVTIVITQPSMLRQSDPAALPATNGWAPPHP